MTESRLVWSFSCAQLERFLVLGNLRGFTRAGFCDSSWLLELEASLHDPTLFQ